MPPQHRNAIDLIVALQHAATALREHYPDQTLVLGARTWTGAELAQAFEDHVTQLHAANEARQAYQLITQKNRARHSADINPALVALRAFIGAQFGATSMFSEFGFVVRQRHEPSSKTKVIAAEKRRATRKARGTLGRKQRLAIKAAVPTTLVVNVPTPEPEPEPGSEG